MQTSWPWQSLDSLNESEVNVIAVEQLIQTATEEHLVEFVERKGLGHPDSICDA